MTKFWVGVIQAILFACVGITVQQLIAAAVYGIFAYPLGTNLRVSWFDYVEEYLLWRIRMPTHGMTRVQIVSNAISLLIVVVGSILLYETLY